MKRLAAVAAAGLAVLLAAAAPAALGHGGNSNYRSVIDSVTPAVPGVEVSVRNYDAELELVVRDGNRVLLYGYEDEPYARVLADGTVQVNQRSPATYINEDRYGTTKAPALADPEAPPRWKTIDGSGTFVFHDHRMHYMAPGVAPQVKDEDRKTKVFDYSIPIRVDGTAGEIDGTLYWVGSGDTSKLPFAIAGVAVVLLGGLGVLVLRRRRAGGGGDEAAAGGKEAW